MGATKYSHVANTTFCGSAFQDAIANLHVPAPIYAVPLPTYNYTNTDR